MKRFLSLLLLFSLLLAGCQTLFPPTTSGDAPSDSDMATRVAQILTTMPTATQAPTEEPKGELPTVGPTATQGQAQEPVIVTDTPAPTEPPAPTETPVLPTATVTSVLPSVTPTVTRTPPAGDPRSLLGNPNWTDNMDDGDYWPTGNDSFTSIRFENGQLLLTAEQDIDGWRLSYPTIQNFYLEAAIKTGECSGSDHYGMIVRVPEPAKADQGYLFGLTCDGRYSLRRWNGRVGTKGEMVWLQEWKTDAAIISGSNQTNRMGILAQGSRLTLYVNGVKVGEVNDSTYTGSGGFGLFIGQDNTDNLTIAVDSVSYWENPNL